MTDAALKQKMAAINLKKGELQLDFLQRCLRRSEMSGSSSSEESRDTVKHAVQLQELEVQRLELLAGKPAREKKEIMP